jgi:WD40 repeat protein
MVITLNETDAILWDARTGELIRTFEGAGKSAAFSSDGQFIATGGKPDPHLWNIETGELVRSFVGHTYDVLGITFSPDGQTIITDSGDSFPKAFDTDSGELLYTLDILYFSKLTMTFLPDGKTLLTSTIFEDSTRLWDARTGKFLRQLEGAEAVVSPDGRLVVTKLDNGWGVVSDVASGEILYILRGQRFFLYAAWSPDSKTVLTSGPGRGMIIWNVGGSE